MTDFVTDTHPLIWHLTGEKRLSPIARKLFLEADAGLNRIYVPAIVLIEMVYLVEKGVLPKLMLEHLLSLLDTLNGSYQPLANDTSVARTMLQKVPWSAVPELADRIITATAIALDLPLITKDQRIIDAQVVRIIW